ncbi:MAG: hypothetical protein L6R40_008767, partial [Gallowayella cf. fulva]
MVRFPNGFGASIVRHDFSYGGASGLWEAAPIKFLSERIRHWEFVGQDMGLPGFDNDDVRGWMTEQDVDEFLIMVESLTQNGLPSATKNELADLLSRVKVAFVALLVQMLAVGTALALVLNEAVSGNGLYWFVFATPRKGWPIAERAHDIETAALKLSDKDKLNRWRIEQLKKRHDRLQVTTTRENIMVDPADIDTIRTILANYGVDDLVGPALFESLASELENRENIMVTEIGPRLWAKGLDTIIDQRNTRLIDPAETGSFNIP